MAFFKSELTKILLNKFGFANLNLYSLDKKMLKRFSKQKYVSLDLRSIQVQVLVYVQQCYVKNYFLHNSGQKLWSVSNEQLNISEPKSRTAGIKLFGRLFPLANNWNANYSEYWHRFHQIRNSVGITRCVNKFVLVISR